MKHFHNVIALALLCLVGSSAKAQARHVKLISNAGPARTRAAGFWTGEKLTTIGMPCGGIGAGQLYVRGDGTLACWWINNNAHNTGQGATQFWNFDTALGPWKTGYQAYTPASNIDQGFILIVNGHTFNLDNKDFNNIRFTGEYPVATINYLDSKRKLPVSVSVKVFSPFIPLNAAESSLPGTVMQFTVNNTSRRIQNLEINGHLQNLIGLELQGKIRGYSRNQVKETPGLTSIYMDLSDSSLPADHPYQGNLCLSLLGAGHAQGGKSELGKPLVARLGTSIRLKPGKSRVITYLLTWYFPNRPAPQRPNHWTAVLPTDGPVIGNHYATKFNSALEVARYLKANLSRLQSQTFAFVDAYYHQQTLPYWLIRRIMMPMANLATETTQWWSDGRFWAWEGVGSCYGTCTHVWNYAQGMAYLFPELERNVRERSDLLTSFNTADGRIAMRGGGGGWATDGQAGTVLKAYREHLMSKSGLFLSRNWQRIKKAEQYLIKEDGDGDGLIEGAQPNTYDIDFFGANTFIGSLYLASLKAASKMALLQHDEAFANTCDSIARNGTVNTEAKLWNGHYFIQDVDAKIHPNDQYGKGCLSDQLFGQTWADLLNLGDLYAHDKVRTTLRSIYQYNWTKDVGPHIAQYKPERPFANPGEPGLFICTWPTTTHPGENGVRYADEVWTGIEYQVATGMIYAGMIKEALVIVKGVDSRYSPEKHNPYNEFECGDHYARSLASYGLLNALEGYHYDGPAQSLSFDPKLHPENFSGFFVAAEGWGNFSQKIRRNQNTQIIKIFFGQLSLKTLKLKCGPGQKIRLTSKGKPISFTIRYFEKEATLQFEPFTIKPDHPLSITISLISKNNSNQNS